MIQTRLRTLRRPPIHHNLLRRTRSLIQCQNHLSRHNASPSFCSTATTSTKSQQWGLFSDIHFQTNDLPRIVATAEWIIDTFRASKVSQIICLGDVLNTRESVNVQALSATVRFLDSLKSIAPVHILLGNHDMNLRHSARVSSLDYLDTDQGITVYRDVTAVEVDGVRCLMVPWAENHLEVVERLKHILPEEKQAMLMFGHLAVSGAITQPFSSKRSHHRQHVGVLRGSHLVDFKSVFLGHFHHHQRLGREAPVWYVGAPMQHDFRDKSDERRGVLLLDPNAIPTAVESFQFVQNPAWDMFREVSLEELKSAMSGAAGVGTDGNSNSGADPVQEPKLPFDIRGKRINLRCHVVDTPEFEAWRRKLMAAGASDVRRKLEVGRAVRLVASPQAPSPASCSSSPSSKGEETFRAPTTDTFIEALPAFLATIPAESNLIPESQFPLYISSAERLMRLADSNNPLRPTSSTSSLPIFHATIRSLSISNFFSVQGTLTIPFHALQPGTWLLTGANGAGKSTLLEAVVWCLFGRVLRSGMSLTDPVNDVVGKNCAVSIEFENGYTIERIRNYPSRGAAHRPALKLYKHGREVENFERGEYSRTQEALERDVIGCDFAMFSKTVIFGDQGSGAGNFLTLEKNARREVLEELLGISAFEGYLKSVKEERKALEKEHLMLKTRSDSVAAELARLQLQFTALKKSMAPKSRQKQDQETQLNVLTEETVRFEAERAEIQTQQGEMLRWNDVYEQLARLQERKTRAQELVQTKADEVANMENDLQRLRGLAPVREQWTRLCKEKQELSKQLQGLEVQLARAGEKSRDTDRSIKKFQERVSKGLCPTCQQSLHDRTHVEKLVAELTIKKDEASQEMQQLSAAKDSVTRALKGHDQEIASLIHASFVTEMFLAHLPEKVTEIEQCLLRYKSQLLRLQADMSAVDTHITRLLGSRSLEEIAALAHRTSTEHESSSSLQSAITTHNRLVKQIQGLSSRRTVLTSSLARLTAELRLGSDQLSQLLNQLGALSDELSSNSARVAELAGSLRVLLFWETAFNKKSSTTTAPNMRHFLISNSISELNDLIAVNMSVLTSPALRSSSSNHDNANAEEFENAREKRGKSLDPSAAADVDELSIAFTPDLSIDRPSFFGKRSSGQRKRNNLAVLFALFLLIRQRSRFRADFIMLDEVFDALDAHGQIQASELIASVTGGGGGGGSAGTEEVRHVIVVTHSEKLEDVVRVGAGGGGVLRVVMTERGTDIWDPEGLIEHFWGVADAEEMVSDVVKSGKAKKKGRRSRKALEPEQELISRTTGLNT
ncbi:hypothetical protein RUND412_004354 [Rhizina undulata]